MTRSLLLRGMIVGIIAGLLVFFAAHWLGEPQVERSLAFETASDQTKGEAPESPVFSRGIQRTAGLLTAAVTYGAALGGIFGLFFAYFHGRVGPTSPRLLAATLAGLGFVAIAFVPTLKYPANPPAVGAPETIGIRTAAFFLMILISIAAMILSVQIAHRLIRNIGAWNGTLAGAAIFVAVVATLAHMLPVVNEVPDGFPADVLWHFRLASWALQLVLWGAIGLLFGLLTERDPHWPPNTA